MRKTTGVLVAFLGAVTMLVGSSSGAIGQTKSLQLSKGGTLEVKLEGGDVHIRTTDGSNVTVQGAHGERTGSQGVEVTQSGNTIRVTSNGDEVPDGVTITVPSQINLSLETSYGDLSVDGKLTGQVDARTGAGSIMVDDVDGTVELTTSGGDLKTGKLTGDGTLRTSGGDIHVEGVGGQLDIKTAGGDISVGDVGKSLRASTSGGDITIGDVGGEAQVTTSGGNIRAGRANGKVSLTTAGGDIELVGGSGTVRAASSGGNLNLRNVSGSVDASSAGGDVYAELIPSGKGKSRLVTAGGNVTLLVPENARATIEARIRIERQWGGRRADFSIQSDFAVDSSSQQSGDREIYKRYTLNGGGEKISLETVNSDISIKKLSGSR